MDSKNEDFLLHHAQRGCILQLMGVICTVLEYWTLHRTKRAGFHSVPGVWAARKSDMQESDDCSQAFLTPQ